MVIIGDLLKQKASALFSFCQKPKSTLRMLRKKPMQPLPKCQQRGMSLSRAVTTGFQAGRNVWRGLRTILSYQQCGSTILSIWKCDMDVFRGQILMLKWAEWQKAHARLKTLWLTPSSLLDAYTHKQGLLNIVKVTLVTEVTTTSTAFWNLPFPSV